MAGGASDEQPENRSVMVQIDFALPEKLADMGEEELGQHMTALLIAVDFDRDAFVSAIGYSDEDGDVIYGTTMSLFAQRWLEHGSPDEDLQELVRIWQIITA